jgi:hypothetical protein
MAMDKAVLGQAIADRILAMVPFGIIVPNDTKASMREFWTAIADEIITHITENAVIPIMVETTATGVVLDATGTPIPNQTCQTTGTGSGTATIE